LASPVAIRLRKNAPEVTNGAAAQGGMDHHILVDLHRNLRQKVGYRGGDPSPKDLEAALCKLRAAHDSTDLGGAFTVEITVFVVAFLAAGYGAYQIGKAAYDKKQTLFATVAGLLAIALGMELLYLIMSGAIRGKLRLRDRLDAIYDDFGSNQDRIKLPSRPCCDNTGGGQCGIDKLVGGAKEKKGGGEGNGESKGSDGDDGKSRGDGDGKSSGDGDKGSGESKGAGGGGSPNEDGAADPGAEAARRITRAIRTGLMKTDIHQVTQGINEAISAIRGLVGAGSVREPDETDYAAVIADVIVPEMLEARRGMSKGSQALGEAASADACSEECADTAKSILASFQTGEDLTTERLESAWAECPDAMRGMCGDLTRPQDRCAAMCNTAGHQVRKIHAVMGYVPGDDWTLHEAAKTESQCWKSCGDDYDAAMFVRKDGLKGSAKCYLHGADGGYREFVRAEAATGSALVKSGSPMVLPGNSPSHAAEAIVESMRARSLAIDLTAHRDEVFRELARQAPTSHEEDRAWFEECVAAITASLAGEEESSGRIPSAPHFKRALENMTAHDFQSKVAWPVLASTVYFDVRNQAAMADANVDEMESGLFKLDHAYYAVFATGAALACVGVLAWIAPPPPPPPPDEDEEDEEEDDEKARRPPGQRGGDAYVSDYDQAGGRGMGKFKIAFGDTLGNKLRSGADALKNTAKNASTSLKAASGKLIGRFKKGDAKDDESGDEKGPTGPRTKDYEPPQESAPTPGSTGTAPAPDFVEELGGLTPEQIQASEQQKRIDENVAKANEAKRKSDLAVHLANNPDVDGDFGSAEKAKGDPALAAVVELEKERDGMLFRNLGKRKDVSGMAATTSSQPIMENGNVDDEDSDASDDSSESHSEGEGDGSDQPGKKTAQQRLGEVSDRLGDLFQSGLKGFRKGAKGAFETTKEFTGTALGATGTALGATGSALGYAANGMYKTAKKGYVAAKDAAVTAAPAVQGGGSAILKAVLDNAATLALVALLITVASTNFVYWMNKRRHNKQRHRENTEALLARVCELSRLLGEISGRPRLGEDADDEVAPPGGCWGDGAGGRTWEDDDAQRDLRAAIFAKDRSVLPQLPDDTRSTPVLHALSTAQRNRLLASCVEVLQAYDRCNDAAANSSAVFPLADVIVYGMVSVGCVVAVVYMYTQLEGGAMFDCARKISAALEDARAGKPGAVAFLRAEIDACSQAGANGTEPMDVVKSVGKWSFVAVLVLATVMLSKESAVSYENRGDQDCAR
jgi:hypothetical protein